MKMPTNGGFLRVEDIDAVEGTKVLIYKEAKFEDISFTGKDGREVEMIMWNVKVKMPDGRKFLAKIGNSIQQDAIKDAYGDESSDWIGHTLLVRIESNKFGEKLVFAPTSDERNMEGCEVDKPLSEADKQAIQIAKEAEATPATDESDADKIPF